MFIGPEMGTLIRISNMDIFDFLFNPLFFLDIVEKNQKPVF